MPRPFRTRRLVAVLALTLAPVLLAQEPLGHEIYETWRSIEDEAISADGRWVLYTLTVENDGDTELVIRNVGDGREFRVARAGRARFSADVTHVVALRRPARADRRQARLEDVPQAEQPRDDLVVVDLASGEQTVIERVQSYLLPEDAGGWVAYLHHEAPPAEEPPADDAAAAPEVAEPNPSAGEPAPEADEREPKDDGTRLVWRSLDGQVEAHYESVIDYAVSADGALLAYTTSTGDDSGDGAYAVAVADAGPGPVRPLLEGPGHYSDIVAADTGGRVAFLADRDTYDQKQPELVLYAGRVDGDARPVARQGTAGVPAGWWVSGQQTPQFSATGARLYFGTAPRPEPEPDEEPVLDEEQVVVDIWNWKDPLLQPMQKLQAEQERNRTYLAVAHLDDDRVVQLADESLPDIELFDDGDADYAHGSSGLPYRQEISWDFPSYSDHYLVDVGSGERQRVAERQQATFETSPDGGWALWWDNAQLAWYGRALSRNNDGTWTDAHNLTATIRHPVHNEDHDWPYRPMPYGFAGWRQVPEAERDGGAAVEALVYDRYDLWAVDPAAARAPRHITVGMGRDEDIRLRLVNLDRESDWVTADTLLLSGLHEGSKDSGFWSVRPDGPEPPEQLIREPKRFGYPVKADAADVLMYTREDVAEFPDLWVTGLDFSDAQKVSAANPQQDDYLWATAELTSWNSLDGEPLQGLVHKPADFDPDRRYPMIVYFYERNADNLHQYHPPLPHRSVIRPTWYASRGYVVFTPDITYEVGYPGESALKDVLPGVLHMVDQGYVDADNIGVQGHSWGGYQIAYLVTKTNVFKAAAGGAPVSNMTSAYGGIRWGSGMSRMFQYEKTQSRLGGSLWEAPLRYLENSPVFWADKVETPLLMMHNDHDGAVPWEQGIEMFVALRRLGKPAWLVNYNDEPHWPTTYANRRDWNIRMQQYFDHYLKGAPAPVWLEEGVPAIRKGETLGLELIDGAGRRESR